MVIPSSKIVGQTGRWFNYFMSSGDDFHEFWKTFLREKERNVLFVLSLGFDPRATKAYEAIVNKGGSGKRDVLAISLDEGADSPSKNYFSLISENRKSLLNIIPSDGVLISRTIQLKSDGRRIGSRRAAEIFEGSQDFSDYTDVVVDVSAMPRGIFFPLIAKILYIYDNTSKNERRPNIHVIVAENILVDKQIEDQGIERDASYMYGFTGELGSEADSTISKVWVPILGEKQTEQFERIHDMVNPVEVCPILPMPSVDPRRADSLLLEYRRLLFDRIQLEPRNVGYVPEQNPFEVYRVIYQMVMHYNMSLKPLGGCRVVLSALSSKLISMGAMLVAYELKEMGVGIAHVETLGYGIGNEALVKKESGSSILFSFWLAGECYDS